MSRRVRRFPYDLDAKGLKELSDVELKAILRGADGIIGRGGRTLLSRILRGSRIKQVLERGLDKSPVYGVFHDLSNEDVLARIDWTIINGYLAIEYDYRLPVLVFTQKGWEIERETYAAELLAGFDDLLKTGPPYDMGYLKDRDRGMILLLLEKIVAAGDAKYIPILKAWRAIDYQKVRRRIGHAIREIERGEQ